MAVGADLSRLSISQLHELTGRDRRWLKKCLAEAGVDPLGKDGRTLFYPARDSLEAIYGKSRIDAGDELAKLNRAKRELAEIELAERREELVPIAESERAVVEILSGVRAQVLAIPAAVAQELAGVSDAAECNGILETAIRHALTAIADTEIVPPETPEAS